MNNSEKTFQASLMRLSALRQPKPKKTAEKIIIDQQKRIIKGRVSPFMNIRIKPEETPSPKIIPKSEFGKTFSNKFKLLKKASIEDQKSLLLELDDFLYKAEDDGSVPAVELGIYQKELNDWKNPKEATKKITKKTAESVSVIADFGEAPEELKSEYINLVRYAADSIKRNDSDPDIILKQLEVVLKELFIDVDVKLNKWKNDTLEEAQKNKFYGTYLTILIEVCNGLTKNPDKMADKLEFILEKSVNDLELDKVEETLNFLKEAMSSVEKSRKVFEETLTKLFTKMNNFGQEAVDIDVMHDIEKIWDKAKKALSKKDFELLETNVTNHVKSITK